MEKENFHSKINDSVDKWLEGRGVELPPPP